MTDDSDTHRPTTTIDSLVRNGEVYILAGLMQKGERRDRLMRALGAEWDEGRIKDALCRAIDVCAGRRMLHVFMRIKDMGFDDLEIKSAIDKGMVATIEGLVENKQLEGEGCGHVCTLLNDPGLKPGTKINIITMLGRHGRIDLLTKHTEAVTDAGVVRARNESLKIAMSVCSEKGQIERFAFLMNGWLAGNAMKAHAEKSFLHGVRVRIEAGETELIDTYLKRIDGIETHLKLMERTGVFREEVIGKAKRIVRIAKDCSALPPGGDTLRPPPKRSGVRRKNSLLPSEMEQKPGKIRTK
jgi:hypothetical protein